MQIKTILVDIFSIIYPQHNLTLKIITAILVAFGITFLAIPQIIKVAKEKLLLDQPDIRKHHVAPMPSIGGLGIFAGFAIAGMFTVDLQLINDLQFIFDAAFIIFFVGLLDDILGLSPLKKLFGQVMASLPLVYKGGYVINNLHGFMGIGPIHEFWAIGLSFLAILMFMNAFNLIDGVDGLAGGLGLMATSILGIWFFLNNESEYAAIAACLFGSLLAFLFYNYHPAKIFMGDTGSLLIGTIASALAIHFLKVAGNSSFPLKIANPATIVFSIFFIPLFDTIRVFAVRLVKGKSPFSADRRHIHHLLMVIGFSPTAIMYLLIIVNLLFIAFTYSLSSLNSTLVFVILFSLGIALTAWVQITARKFYKIRITKSLNKGH